jgi:CDP-6-deoxy-D-xylo-4-hexulose-3-dehydrase
VLPEPTPGSDPSWFGFAITVRPDAPFTRDQITRHLEDNKIATRLLFGGDLTQQPAYRDIPHRVSGELRNTKTAMNRTFWVGVYPGLTEEMLSYVVEQFEDFLTSRGPALRVVG